MDENKLKKLQSAKINRKAKAPWGRRKGAGLFIKEFAKGEVKWK